MVMRAREKAGLVSVPEHLLPIWMAFDILNRARGFGYSMPLRLTLTELEACRSILDIPNGVRFCHLIQAMDECYLTVFREQAPRQK